MGDDDAIARNLAYAPYADLLVWKTSEPDLDTARHFAEAIHRTFPGKMVVYNGSSSFNWKRKLSPAAIGNFQREIGAMGYKFQFVTLAGSTEAAKFHDRATATTTRHEHDTGWCTATPGR